MSNKVAALGSSLLLTVSLTMISWLLIGPPALAGPMYAPAKTNTCKANIIDEGDFFRATVVDATGTKMKFKFEPVELSCVINQPINPCLFCFSLVLRKQYQNSNVWVDVNPPYPKDLELSVDCDATAKKTLLNDSPYLVPGHYEISLYCHIESCAYCMQSGIAPAIFVSYEFDVN